MDKWTVLLFVWSSLFIVSSCGGGGTASTLPPSAPAVTLSAKSLTFSSQVVGTWSAAQSVTLTNTGNAMLHISKMSTTGDFWLYTATVGGIPAGQSFAIPVKFAPVGVGVRTGSVSIVDDAAGSPQTITLTGTGQEAPISIQLSAGTLTATQDGAAASIDVTVTRTPGNANSVTLSVTGLPTGASTQITSPGTGNAGTVVFHAPPAVAAGTYAVTISASDGQFTASAPLSLTVAVVATIGTTTNTLLGEGGKLDDFMTTSFQPASWSDNFFTSHPNATVALDALGAQHIRIQALERDIPMTGATTWDFSHLDAMVNPILSVADHSPEFQIAVAPSWMNDSAGHLNIASHLQDFADYCANLVRYYNAGGFDANGTHYQSSSPYPINWWGIFNEPNINGLTAAQYVQLYNTVVPAMQAVDPTLKFSAVELADFGTEPQNYMPAFVAGVTAQVDVVSTHFYSSCNQRDSDQHLFSTIPNFVNDVKYIYSQLATNPALASVPVWVTENNVNADFNNGSGMSNCNPGMPFVTDQRGTSAYFAAWRPYVFSQLAQAGVRGLYHWDYNADAQYGEVDGETGQIYRSYWADYWLGQNFAPAADPVILNQTVTEMSTVEILSVSRADGSVVVMIVNRAVRASGDNNGPGDPRTVVVDFSAWPAFTSATTLTINAATDLAAGPAPQAVPPASRMNITMNGYGVTFLTLNP